MNRNLRWSQKHTKRKPTYFSHNNVRCILTTSRGLISNNRDVFFYQGGGKKCSNSKASQPQSDKNNNSWSRSRRPQIFRPYSLPQTVGFSVKYTEAFIDSGWNEPALNNVLPQRERERERGWGVWSPRPALSNTEPPSYRERYCCVQVLSNILRGVVPKRMPARNAKRNTGIWATENNGSHNVKVYCGSISWLYRLNYAATAEVYLWICVSNIEVPQIIGVLGSILNHYNL